MNTTTTQSDRVSKILLRIKKRVEQQDVNFRIIQDIHKPNHIHWRNHNYLHQINKSNRILSMMLSHLEDALPESFTQYDRLKIMQQVQKATN